VSFREGGFAPNPHQGLCPWNPLGDFQPPDLLCPKSWLCVCCLSAESASIAVDSVETRPGDDDDDDDDDDDNDVCVCAADFGLSKIVDSELQTQTVCGTPGYCCLSTLSITCLLAYFLYTAGSFIN